MKYILVFSLLFYNAVHAQKNAIAGNMPYPDLIPILVHENLYGYCNMDLKIVIKPRYEYAGLFEQDNDMVVNPDKKISRLGGSDYAWVKLKGKKLRINKKGKIVYTYNEEDFRNLPPVITEYMPLPHVPFEKYIEPETLLWGIRNENTKTILIKPKYTSIQKELYDDSNELKYPLILVTSNVVHNSFYVGLNGKEFIIPKG